MQDWIASASPRSFLAEDHTKWHLVVSDFDKSFENQSAIDLRKIGGQLTMARSSRSTEAVVSAGGDSVPCISIGGASHKMVHVGCAHWWSGGLALLVQDIDVLKQVGAALKQIQTEVYDKGNRRVKFDSAPLVGTEVLVATKVSSLHRVNLYRAIVAKIDSSLKAVSVSLGDFGILVDNVPIEHLLPISLLPEDVRVLSGAEPVHLEGYGPSEFVVTRPEYLHNLELIQPLGKHVWSVTEAAFGGGVNGGLRSVELRRVRDRVLFQDEMSDFLLRVSGNESGENIPLQSAWPPLLPNEQVNVLEVKDFNYCELSFDRYPKVELTRLETDITIYAAAECFMPLSSFLEELDSTPKVNDSAILVAALLEDRWVRATVHPLAVYTPTNSTLVTTDKEVGPIAKVYCYDYNIDMDVPVSRLYVLSEDILYRLPPYTMGVVIRSPPDLAILPGASIRLQNVEINKVDLFKADAIECLTPLQHNQSISTISADESLKENSVYVVNVTSLDTDREEVFNGATETNSVLTTNGESLNTEALPGDDCTADTDSEIIPRGIPSQETVQMDNSLEPVEKDENTEVMSISFDSDCKSTEEPQQNGKTLEVENSVPCQIKTVDLEASSEPTENLQEIVASITTTGTDLKQRDVPELEVHIDFQVVSRISFATAVVIRVDWLQGLNYEIDAALANNALTHLEVTQLHLHQKVLVASPFDQHSFARATVKAVRPGGADINYIDFDEGIKQVRDLWVCPQEIADFPSARCTVQLIDVNLQPIDVEKSPLREGSYVWLLFLHSDNRGVIYGRIIHEPFDAIVNHADNRLSGESSAAV